MIVVFAFFHSQRLMFVFVTLFGKWNRTLTKAQHILFMTSGTVQDQFLYTNYLNSLFRSVLLFQLHSQPHPVLSNVQEVPAGIHGYQEEPDLCPVLYNGG